MFSLCSDEEEDDEEVYKMAGVMAQCGGLECMLNRLSGIKDFKQGRHLLTVSMKFTSLIHLTLQIPQKLMKIFDFVLLYRFSSSYLVTV